MKYYILSYSADPKEVGSFSPQLKVVQNPVVPFRGISKYRNDIIPDDVVIPDYKVHHQAKMNDLMSSTLIGIPLNPIISERFGAVLQQFKSTNYQLIRVNVIDKKKECQPYYVFHQYERSDHYIDFSKTIFRHTLTNVYTSPPTYAHKEYQFQDFDALWGYIQQHKGHVCAKHFYLTEEQIEHDFFVLTNPLIWVINEKVAEALQAAKLTGLALIALNPGETFCDDNVVTKAMRLVSEK